MIKLKEITSSEVDENSGVETVVATLYADTKAEVSDSITGFDVDGLPDECEIGTMSMVITADFQPAQLNSSHHWVWG